MLKFSIEGREELRKALRKDCERMKAAAEDMSGDVPIEDLLTDGFMQAHTSCSSCDEFLAACGIGSEADFEAMSEATLNAHVSAHSKFRSWDEMLGKALELYAVKGLGF